MSGVPSAFMCVADEDDDMVAVLVPMFFEPVAVVVPIMPVCDVVVCVVLAGVCDIFVVVIFDELAAPIVPAAGVAVAGVAVWA